MWFRALATDYDGTLAQHGRVDDVTAAALRRLKASDRRLVLVTGRSLEGLLETFPQAPLCDRIVAENGAVLYRPQGGEQTLLGAPVDAALVAELRALRVEPLAVGRALIATLESSREVVLEVVRRRGLDLQVSLNRGAVMLLPAGVDKASGLATALLELGLSPRDAVGVGDAENDFAFLQHCGLAAAVAGAVPALREHVDVVTGADAGAGVAELIGALLEDDHGPSRYAARRALRRRYARP
jgi:HAD superfamily hydrolase (TIGR01484 family)